MAKKKEMSLSKIKTGPYHRNEWSIIGAPCSVINTLSEKIISNLSEHLKVSYLNETHHFENEMYNKYTASGPVTDTHKFDVDLPRLSLFRKYFDHLDVLLLNGNHYKADKQIVIINEKKRQSLHKKLDRLSDVKMILVDNSKEDIYPYLSEHLHPIDEDCIVQIDDIESICAHIINDYRNTIPPIFGLVLSGGRSQRMGTDKSKINYHNKPQSEYAADMLLSYTKDTYISVGHDYNDGLDSSYKTIRDSYLNLGPMGGILSAFRYNPNVAWLTIACDLPYLKEETLEKLLTKRDPSKLATCYYNAEKGSPEPLITIWETRAYPAMLDYLSMGYASPSKVLRDNDVCMIEVRDHIQFINVNDPLQKKTAIERLHK